MTRTVITHPEWGVFLGVCWGLGFFSKLDCAGQHEACTFEDETDAAKFIRTWEENSDPSIFTFVSVKSGEFATIAELKEAGIDTTEMEREWLMYGSEKAARS